jgi:hypothetical protein
MDDPGEPERTDAGRRPEQTPDSALSTAPFDLVSEETRAAILGALATHHARSPESPSVGFAALRDRAGIEDSGNFNYHLDKLQPVYVRQTEDGYVLTHAGLSLVGTLRAGVGSEAARGPESLDATCRICETPLTARYEDGLISVLCENDHKYPQDFLPPNAVDGRDLREAIAIQKRRTLHDIEMVREGVCPACFDDIERDHRVLDEPQASHVLVGTCEGCGRISGSPVGLHLLREPVVVSFYHDHGVDVTEAPLWELDLAVAEPTVRSEGPLRLALSVEKDGERLALVVDEYSHLLDSERTCIDS